MLTGPAMPRQLLTLADVALLAQVQRPVVTTWRARAAGSATPFPAPAEERGGQQLFSAEDVVSWLEATHHGNNPDPATDVVAFTLGASQIVQDERLFAGLSALLCLRVVTGELPDDPAELLDLADASDPDDLMLFGEIEAVEDVLPGLARLATLLADTAYHPADPHEDLVRRRRAAARRPVARLAPALRQLVAGAAWAVADQAGFADPTFVVSSADDLELILTVAEQGERRGAVVAALRTDDDRALRLGRRRLRVHDIVHVDLHDDGVVGLEELDGAIVLLSLTGSGRQADEAALRSVSELSLSMTPRHRALVVGASTALTDALRPAGAPPGRPAGDDPPVSEATLVRRDVIKTGLLRGVVRLPPGGMPDRIRARAALWCLGPSNRRSGQVPYSWCADVPSELSEAICDTLVTDLVAAMAGPHEARGHRLGHGRFVPTSELQLTSGDLVAPMARGRAEVVAAEVVQRLAALSATVAEGLVGVDGVGVTAVAATGAAQHITVQEAIRRQHVRWVRGARIEAGDLTEHGSIPVVTSVDHLQAPTAGIDRLLHAARFPRGQLTRPGDVVVTTAGGPRAAVDHRGGAFVGHPARVLRLLDGAPMTPETLAADVNAQPAKAKDPRAWSLTVVPEDQVVGLHETLAALEVHRRELRARLRDLGELEHAVTTGLSSGTCRLWSDTVPTTDEGR